MHFIASCPHWVFSWWHLYHSPQALHITGVPGGTYTCGTVCFTDLNPFWKKHIQIFQPDQNFFPLFSWANCGGLWYCAFLVIYKCVYWCLIFVLFAVSYCWTAACWCWKTSSMFGSVSFCLFASPLSEVLIFSLMRKMLMKGMLNMIPFSVPRGLFCPPSEEQCYSCVMWNSKLCCAVLRSEQEPFKLSGSSCHLWLAQMCPDVWLRFCNLL